MARKQCHVYILTNRSGTLYIGVTGDLLRRLQQHRLGEGSNFAKRYAIGRLVHCECYERAMDAIAREKQLKGWVRPKKIALINSANPMWAELAPEDLQSF